MNLVNTIPATLEAVSGFIQSLDELWAEMPLPVRIGITLPLQELCVNIVEHAYDGHEGSIDIELKQNDQQITISLIDSAPRAFVPPSSITSPDLNDLPEGGMGLFIIYQSFDQVDYERLEHGNHWRLTKKLS